MRARNEPATATHLLFLLCTLTLAGLASAQDHAHVRKLSGPLPSAHVADVVDYAVVPGERWIVYRADATRDELTLVPPGTPTP